MATHLNATQIVLIMFVYSYLQLELISVVFNARLSFCIEKHRKCFIFTEKMFLLLFWMVENEGAGRSIHAINQFPQMNEKTIPKN